MIELVHAVRDRNEVLFFFGLVCLAATIVFLLLTQATNIQVMGINAWYKPLKFSISTFFYAWAMAWYCYYLGDRVNVALFSWLVVAMLGFEIVYIAVQAGRGQLSHYNVSSPFYSLMFSCMAAAATLVTLFTAYIGLLFLSGTFPELPAYYVWGIRIGIFIFVLFSFQGFAMGARMTHTIGGPDGSAGIALFNWSLTHGDLRVAHFIGMHALQVLPILSYYILKSVRLTLLSGLLYAALAVFTLMHALQGKPFYKI